MICCHLSHVMLPTKSGFGQFDRLVWIKFQWKISFVKACVNRYYSSKGRAADRTLFDLHIKYALIIRAFTTNRYLHILNPWSPRSKKCKSRQATPLGEELAWAWG